MGLIIILIIFAVSFGVMTLLLYIWLRESQSRRQYSEDLLNAYKNDIASKEEYIKTLKYNSGLVDNLWQHLVAEIFWPKNDWVVDFRIISIDNCPVDIIRKFKIGSNINQFPHYEDEFKIRAKSIEGDRDTLTDRIQRAQMICDLLNDKNKLIPLKP